MSEPIKLVLADVDGTLVTNDKRLTDDARAAVADLHRAGIKFAITSGRPPRGMAMLVEPLAIDTPIAGFNGGVMMAPDMKTVLNSLDLPDDIIQRALDLLAKFDLDAWIYTKTRWLVRDIGAPHVDREARTVKFDPELVKQFTGDHLKSVVKIVGVTDDHASMRQAVAAAKSEFGDSVTALTSQPYYLDITNRKANKGEVVDKLSEILHIPTRNIATIGDMPNDVSMFARSGMSIAMGNADDEVKSKASNTTESNEHDGFAKAIRRYVLERRDP